MDLRQSGAGLLEGLISSTLHDPGLKQVDALLLDIELHHSLVSLLLVLDLQQLVVVQSLNVADVSQPIFNQTCCVALRWE